jgi:antitoxin CptB
VSDEALLKRLRWRCRRGMTELDRVLTWWLEQRVAAAGEVLGAAFGELLECEDTDLWQWLIGRTEPPRADWKQIVDEIRAGYRA